MIKAILTAACFLSVFANAQKDESATYKIDASHTAVVFKISHLGFSHTYGQFPDVAGSFTINESKPEKSTLELSMDVDKINTFDAKRDKHLKSPDFFNSKQFPKITFKSKSVKKVSANNYEISGDLTMHGVTKPLTFTFVRSRTGQDPWGNTRTGGDTTFKVKRSDFGMTYMQGENQIGDEVELIVSVEGIRK